MIGHFVSPSLRALDIKDVKGEAISNEEIASVCFADRSNDTLKVPTIFYIKGGGGIYRYERLNNMSLICGFRYDIFYFVRRMWRNWQTRMA